MFKRKRVVGNDVDDPGREAKTIFDTMAEMPVEEVRELRRAWDEGMDKLEASGSLDAWIAAGKAGAEEAKEGREARTATGKEVSISRASDRFDRLEEFPGISRDQLERILGNLEAGQAKLEERQASAEERLGKLEAGQVRTEERLGKVEAGLENVVVGPGKVVEILQARLPEAGPA